MLRKISLSIMIISTLVTGVSAHCEIPCGVYDDSLRVKLIREHITTVEKSMVKIDELAKNKEGNANQLSRWVTNKEEHANEIQEIVTQYFMTQRIKSNSTEYDKKLSLLHNLLVGAMKAKQTTDKAYIESLRSDITAFEKLYFHKK